VGRGSIPVVPARETLPAAARPGPGASSPPGPSGTSPTADPHPFSPAAEAASLHSLHASQAPSQPAMHMLFFYLLWVTHIYFFPEEEEK